MSDMDKLTRDAIAALQSNNEQAFLNRGAEIMAAALCAIVRLADAAERTATALETLAGPTIEHGGPL